MAADDTWDLAQTDAPPRAAPPPPPSAAPAAAADPTSDYIRQQLALLQAPLPSVQPDTTPAQGGIVGLLGKIGMALAGGSVTDTLSPGQKERAGLRALGDFGTSLMAGSGYYPGKPMFGGLAQGFEGAARSEAGSEQQAASYLGAQQNWQMEQQKLQLERLKEAMPLLQMQVRGNHPQPTAQRQHAGRARDRGRRWEARRGRHRADTVHRQEPARRRVPGRGPDGAHRHW